MDFSTVVAKNPWNSKSDVNENGKILRVSWINVRSIDTTTASTAQMTLECSRQWLCVVYG